VGIDIDNNGNLYVAELANRRIVLIGTPGHKIEFASVESGELTDTNSKDSAISDFSRIIKRTAIGFKLFNTLIKRGRRYRELGNHAKSIADLEAAIGIAPDKLSAYIEAGLTREAAGQNAEAIEIYGRAIERKADLVPSEKFRDRDYLKVLMQRGLAQANEGNHEAAIQDLTSVIDLRKTAVTIFKERDLPSKEVARIWFTRGRIYLDSGNYDKAIADLSQAITLDSKMVKAYYYRGVAYSSAKKYHSAVKDLKTAASLSPSFADPHFELGKIYQSHVVDSVKAIQHLKTYLALDGASKVDAQARIEEIERKLSEKTSTEGNYWEKIVEDEEGKRWIERHYSDGRVQRFPLERDK
jgi:tetratricopeptide (TPR) repeat protein